MTKPVLRDFPDSDLIQRYREHNDFDSLLELYSRYEHLVLYICNGYFHRGDDADDAARDVFVSIAQSLKTNRITQFKAWLGAVTKNYCKHKVTRNQWFNRKLVPLPENFEEKIVESDDFGTLIGKGEDVSRLHKALGSLDEMQRRCIEYFYLQEKSYADIMTSMNLSYKEVKSHLQNGRRNLKNELVRESGEIL